MTLQSAMYTKAWAHDLVSQILHLTAIKRDQDSIVPSWATQCPIPLPTITGTGTTGHDSAEAKSLLCKAQIQDAAWSLVWSLSIVHVKDQCMGSVDQFTAQAEALLDLMLVWLEAQNDSSRYRTLFLKTLDQVIQVSSLASCTSILTFVSNHVNRIKRLIFVKAENNDDFVEERRNLIGMSTNLLKRVSPLLNSELVSAIQLLNSQLLDANASVLNPRCMCNEISLPVPESTLPDTPDAQHLNQIYTQLWQLLGSMHDPRQVLRESPAEAGKVRTSIKTITTAMDKLALEFSRVASVAKEHLRNPAKEKLLEPVSRDFFCPKYLTSRELFDAQIKDPLFRRQVLVHFLIKCEVLLFFSEDRSKEYDTVFAKPGVRRNKSLLPEKFPWLTATEVDELKSVRSRIIIVLSRIPPNGSAFVEAIIQLLREEASWMFWKAQFMQPMFDQPPAQLAEPSPYEPPMLAEPAEVSLGNPRLDMMWKPAANHIEDELPDPDVDQWTSQLDEEIQGDIEREYQLSRKEQWKWQTYRLYLRHHFHTMTAPTTQHPLRDVVRRAKGQPDLTADELAEIREREREAAELRKQMERERQAAEAEERTRKQREREEQEHLKREREEKARMEREEREKKEREEAERKAKEEQEWKTKEEEERKAREQKEKEEAERRKAEEEEAAARLKAEEVAAAARRKAEEQEAAVRRKAAAAELEEKRRQLKLAEEDDARKRKLVKDEDDVRKKSAAEEVAARQNAAVPGEQREADNRIMEERKKRFARDTYSAVPTMSSLPAPQHQQHQSASSSSSRSSPTRSSSNRSPSRSSTSSRPSQSTSSRNASSTNGASSSLPLEGTRGGREHDASSAPSAANDDYRRRRVQDASEAERKRRLAESDAARRKLEESRTSRTSTSPVTQEPRQLPTANVDMVGVDAIPLDRESPPSAPLVASVSDKPIPADLMAAHPPPDAAGGSQSVRSEVSSKPAIDTVPIADARSLISGRSNRVHPLTPSREKSDADRPADGTADSNTRRREGGADRDTGDRTVSDSSRDRHGSSTGNQSQPQERDRRDRASSPPRQQSEMDRRLGTRTNAYQGARPDPPSRSGSTSGPSSRLQNRLGSPPPVAGPSGSDPMAAHHRNPSSSRDRSRDRRDHRGDRNSRRDDPPLVNDRDLDRERGRDRGQQQQVQIALLPRNERGRGARRATPDQSDPDLAGQSARGGSGLGSSAGGMSTGLFSRLTAGLGGSSDSVAESSSSSSSSRRDVAEPRRQGGGETYTPIPYFGDRDHDRERDRDRSDRADRERMRDDDRRDTWSANGNGSGGGGRGGQKRRNDSYRDGRDRNKRHRP